jgi:hypothetical protein
MVAMQSGMQLNDLAGAVLVMVAVALVAAPDDRWSRGRLSLAGLALGLGTATKLAVLPGVVAVCAYTLTRALRGHRVRSLVPAAAAFALAVGPWWVRNLLLFGNPIFPASLPFVGQGMVHAELAKYTGVISRAAAWPLYPLLEDHGETTGLGALFAVAALPGLVVAVGRARPRALWLYGALAGVGLPAWWLLTGHNPRFLLYLAGPAFAFIGWILVAVPKSMRPLASALIGAGAIFSAAVTIDEAVRPLAISPTGRARFYDQVWGVDSTVAALPSADPLLSHTGLARLSWASDYPLLGSDLRRRMISIDGLVATDSIVAIMRPRGIRYAYVPTAPESRADVEAMYPRDRFDLVHSSSGDGPGRAGTWRYLFRLRDPSPP